MGVYTYRYLIDPEMEAEIEYARACIASLTPRGRDVLSGIVVGCSNKVIAHKLGISIRTVEIHRARMMRDLGARHVADAISLAVVAVRLSRRPQSGDPRPGGDVKHPVMDWPCLAIDPLAQNVKTSQFQNSQGDKSSTARNKGRQRPKLSKPERH
jgi:DNA-binding CsgD family transcriptional regulator